MTENNEIIGSCPEEDAINPYFFWTDCNIGRITQSDMKDYVIIPREQAKDLIPPTTTPTCRDAFESWVLIGSNQDKYWIQRHPDGAWMSGAPNGLGNDDKIDISGQYLHSRTADQWKAWQAAILSTVTNDAPTACMVSISSIGSDYVCRDFYSTVQEAHEAIRRKYPDTGALVTPLFTHPTVTPTDGAAERALEWLELILDENDDERGESYKTIKTALQSTREPKCKCGDIIQRDELRCETCQFAYFDASKPPVDTIAVPKEVLQGVREALLNLRVWPTTKDVAEKALASLDAVLSEGKS